MRIYSKSFIHYTKDFEAIKGIIENGFRVHFCKEEVYSESGKTTYIGIPMACFCDITLSHIKEMSKYGKMCVGMGREWGVDHLLQPVLYYPNNKDCESTKMIIEAEKAFIENQKRSGSEQDSESYKILGYAKPLFKLSKKTQDLNCADNSNYIDREWRRVYPSKGQHRWKTLGEYEKYMKKNKDSDTKIHIGSPLKFSVKDIDFIVIQNKFLSDMHKFIMDDLKRIGGKEKVDITQRERELLLSKIITYETLIGNM